jgi:hypothetical protein
MLWKNVGTRFANYKDYTNAPQAFPNQTPNLRRHTGHDPAVRPQSTENQRQEKSRTPSVPFATTAIARTPMR